ncbi:MAG: tetratricopeptide repeat protein [Nitrospira sp.]|nr:tetratricopeptide repeat protein [Nitrospira sp.]
MKHLAIGAICLLALPISGWSFEQETRGPCSPATGNVTGNVTITMNCSGEDPTTVARLNELLDRKDKELGETQLTLEQKVAEANEWIRKYHELETRLAALGETSELSQQAERYFKNLELEKAGAVLDELIKKEEEQVDRVAAHHFSRAQVYDLQFKPLLALPHYEQAYRYRSTNMEYAREYAKLLYHQREFQKAELILTENLKKLRELAQANPHAFGSKLAMTLDNLGRLQRDHAHMAEAQRSFQEAVDVRRKLWQANAVAHGEIN